MKRGSWDLPLKVLYFSWWGRLMRVIVRSRWASAMYGWYCDSSWSAGSIASFVREHAINISEFEKPLEKFKSFNDFFVRSLKKEARPIDQSTGSIVSPGDGSILILSNLKDNHSFIIKGTPFTLNNFLGNQELADQFNDATMIILRLAPYDYHRYHFPFECTPSVASYIQGRLESVNPLVYRAGVQPLIENKRSYFLLEGESGLRALMIAVGAMFVGRISHTYQPDKKYCKGDEAGYFECGGSTIVVLFERDAIEIDQTILERSAQGVETQVKMGERVGRAREKDKGMR